jgi:hypothetical protein
MIMQNTSGAIQQWAHQKSAFFKHTYILR